MARIAGESRLSRLPGRKPIASDDPSGVFASGNLASR
jgi:hypothetical protein